MIPVNERVLIHLFKYKNYDAGSPSVPTGMTQSGIADEVGISVTHVPRAVSKLQADGLVTEGLAHAPQSKRRVKAYFLTMMGKQHARNLMESLLDQEVLLVESDGLQKTERLEDIHREMSSKFGADRTPTLVDLVLKSQAKGFVSMEDFEGPCGRGLVQGWAPTADVDSLVKRIEISEELVSALDRSELVVVQGDEGTGKTSSTLTVMSAIYGDSPINIIYYSKDHEEVDKVEEAKHQLLLDMAKAMGVDCGDGSNKMELAKQVSDQAANNKDGQTLFVLDDLNTKVLVDAGLKVADFLLGLPGRNSVIICLREEKEVMGIGLPSQPDAEVATVRVGGMKKEEARELIGDSLDEGEFDTLYEMTGGNPGWLLKARDTPVSEGEHLDPEERALLRMLKK